MASKVNKDQLNQVLKLTQFYGETLEHLRYVIHGEDKIIDRKFYGPADVGDLLNLRTQRGRLEMMLIQIWRQINEEYGVCMPKGGWVTTDV
jgi:ribosomal protein S28E/S33